MFSPDTSAEIQAIAALASLAVTIGLAGITFWYARLTRSQLRNAEKQIRLAANPVIGIRVGQIHIGEIFGPKRQDLSVHYELTNLTDAPAIGVTIDGEVLLRYTDVKGEKCIPQRFDPEFLEFLKPGESIATNKARVSLSFGNLAVNAILDDFQEYQRLNMERIKADPARESFRGPRLRLVVRYANNLGQRFKSEWEADLGIWDKEHGGWVVPERRENIDITYVYVPRPLFSATPEAAEEMKADLDRMNAKRGYSGW